jgi:aspartate/methionine/tyrosine aminotransferase
MVVRRDPVNGFAPVEGDTFTILTFPSSTGAFVTSSFPALTELSWRVRYDPTAVVLEGILDLDGDGVTNSLDCAPEDASAWSIPAEVTGAAGAALNLPPPGARIGGPRAVAVGEGGRPPPRVRPPRSGGDPRVSQPIVVNPDVLEMEYAVRGPIAQRAAALKKQGRPVIPCHLGNPQALGQQPISFYRQVLGLVEEPARIERERRLGRLLAASPSLAAGDLASDYVLDLAESILSRLETGMGAYTESKGPAFIREAVARYIDRRDGAGSVPADPDHVFLTNGASEGARFVIEALIADRRDGIMIPIPQYPLYSATIRKHGGTQVNYYPDEDDGWSLTASKLEESWDEAQRRGVRVKGIVVINPANPTGAVLDAASIEGVIGFAERHGLVVIADEVYQDNVYGDRFASFARTLGRRAVPLFSLHSTSKGFYGECGHRGGYLEARNPPAVRGSDANFLDVLLKQASVSLCSNTPGQVLTYLMVSPPPAGSAPYDLFVQQRRTILGDLYDKARMIREAFGRMDGVRCFGRTGAMYLFPRLERLPAGATDFDYCMNLLEATGFCTVNGAGFGQRPGTSHLRIAFLPPRAVLEEALPRWVDFHNRYAGGS